MTKRLQEVSGWGGYLKINAQLLYPRCQDICRNYLSDSSSLIARGMGRSYGDSANAARILQTTYLNNFISFDPAVGLLTAEAGVTLQEVLKVVVRQGWFLPVTPGTSFVTLGGAVAGDVHGKNHHLAGTFGKHICSIKLLLGNGEIVTTSPCEFPELFYATCGGLGLTGIILSVTVKLIPIESSFVAQKNIKASCIEDICEKFEIHDHATYSVAWIDCLASGKNLGRSVLMLGEHAKNGGLDLEIKKTIKIPFHTPAMLINSLSMRMFNSIYYNKMASYKNQNIVPLFSYFYPLDSVGSWNKLYGKKGFIQYQFALPKQDGVANMRKILKIIVESGQGSFLAVLKKFGASGPNFLSFPCEGYTLALDFKLTNATIELLSRLDDLVIEMGGRVNLTKDSVLSAENFKKMYPSWQDFENVRHKFSAIGKFASAQSIRLGLE